MEKDRQDNAANQEIPTEESSIDYDMNWESSRYAEVGRMTINLAGSGTMLIDYDAS